MKLSNSQKLSFTVGVIIPLTVAGIMSFPVEVLKYKALQQQTQTTIDNGVSATQVLPDTTILPAILQKIAECESGSTHYNEDGGVLHGKQNPLDIGYFQINLKYHDETAQSMGIDLFVEEDNKAYALHLYKTQGTDPWKLSEECWKE